MFYRPESGHGLPHNPLNALIVPRPIGWISTISEGGVPNLAPYSFFNLVAYSPPTLMFSSTSAHAEGGMKDSAKNAIETGEFVHNVATFDTRFKCNNTSAALPREADEFELAGLTKAASNCVRPFRVAEAPAHFECKTTKVIELGGGSETVLIFGEIVGVHINDEVLVDGMVDIEKLHPLTRMGYMNFSAVKEEFEIVRPG